MKAMKSRLLSCGVIAAVALSASPAVASDTTIAGAAAAAQGSPVSVLPASAAVSAVYRQFKVSPMWFRGNAATPAAAQLVTILRRASVEGVSFGPQAALQVEDAIRRAASGNPAAVAAAEQTLSAAWVSYVQAVRRPTSGMYYAASTLAPQGTRADQVLLLAAASPSLEAHLNSVSNVNFVYAQLRDAAWKQAQATGGAAPDPRLLLNLDRARTFPSTGRFVIVDSAQQRLTMFENGRPVDSMRIIVGMPKWYTPMIASYIHYITMNPYWDAPDNLVVEAIAPNALAQGEKYMKDRGYEVMSDWTVNASVIPFAQVDWKAVKAGTKKIRVRQKPGPKNFMKTMKIPFQNDDDIYLHDTSAPEKFRLKDLAQSNGCVRLEDAPRFARWLLGGRDAVAPSTEPDAHIKLAQGVPVYLTYLTAQPTSEGVAYLKDIYGWDRVGATRQVAAK